MTAIMRSCIALRNETRRLCSGPLFPGHAVAVRCGYGTKGEAGSIGDLFTSLGTAPPVLDARFADLKDKIRPPADVLAAAWERLELAIAKEVAEIQEVHAFPIPSNTLTLLLQPKSPPTPLHSSILFHRAIEQPDKFGKLRTD